MANYLINSKGIKQLITNYLINSKGIKQIAILAKVLIK